MMQHSISKISSMRVPPLAQSEACPPLLLSPSSFGHERRETSAAPLPRRNLDLGAFAFATYSYWMYERVTKVLSDWMPLKSWHSANAQSKQARPLPLHMLSHSAGGTRGQSTLLVVIVEEASTAGFSSREIGHSESLKINI